MYSYKDISTTLNGLEEVRVRFSVSKPSGAAIAAKKRKQALDEIESILLNHKDLEYENNMLVKAMSLNVLGLEEALTNERNRASVLYNDNCHYKKMLDDMSSRNNKIKKAAVIWSFTAISLAWVVSYFIFK